jgi:hypothetical protein
VGSAAPPSRLTAASAADRLTLTLELDRALSIALVDEDCLRDYTRIFRLRLRIAVCLSALNSLTATLRAAASSTRAEAVGVPAHGGGGVAGHNGRGGHLSHELHLLCLFTHEARHFLSALAAHMGSEACARAWEQMRGALHAHISPSVEELRVAHRRYLDSILHGCLLSSDSSAVPQVLHALLALVTQAEQRARANLTIGASSAESCASMRVACATLREHTRFIASAAHEIAGSDQDSPLNMLLLRLDLAGAWISSDS